MKLKDRNINNKPTFPRQYSAIVMFSNVSYPALSGYPLVCFVVHANFSSAPVRRPRGFQHE